MGLGSLAKSELRKFFYIFMFITCLSINEAIYYNMNKVLSIF